MSHTQTQNSYTSQSGYTRVATSICFGAAFMLAFYFLMKYGPTLVDAHALLFRFFETADQAQKAIANFAIWFSLAMQVTLAAACAHVGKQLKGDERLMHSGLTLLWLLHPLALFLATMTLALAFPADELSKYDSPNGTLFSIMCVCALVFFIAFFVGICNTSARSKDNPLFALAAGKALVLLGFAVFNPSKLTLTLVVGSYVLDYLLTPVGDKIRETTPH